MVAAVTELAATGEFKAGDMRHGTLYFGPNGKSTYKYVSLGDGSVRERRSDSCARVAVFQGKLETVPS